MSAPTPPSAGLGRPLVIVIVAALVLLLGYGITHLFSLRFARGDIYPPYSSLRTDPLGSKALAEAISGLPGFTVERNYRELSRLKTPQPATLVYLGINYDAPVDEAQFADAERMVARGSRLVITFIPELKRTTQTRTPSKSKATPSPGATPAPSGFATDERPRFYEAIERWGVSIDFGQDEESSVKIGSAEPAENEVGLEASVPWHTALYFKGLNPKWQTLYQSNNVPVIVERNYGQGSIVLCADSFFLSNEGLRSDRAAKLIARIVGPPRTVVFDEFHHGVSENMNVAGLVRKHGLGGAVLALLAVAALYLWKNAVPFLPARTSASEDGAQVGLDANAGFINLLRRGVPTNRLLAVCVEEWRKSRGRRIREDEQAHVEAVLRAHEGRSSKDAAAAYRAIASELNRH
jgi:hypothetical protein